MDGCVCVCVCIWCVAGGIKHMGGRCIRPTPEELEDFGTPDFTIYNAGQFPCNRYTHYMSSSTSIDLNLKRKEMVILGTQYAGEMKKGLFSLMHYLMPKRGILSLHSGCNMGKAGDVALFFGLSGIVGKKENEKLTDTSAMTEVRQSAMTEALTPAGGVIGWCCRDR